MAFSLCFSFPPNHHHHHHHPRKSLKAAAVAATRVVMNIGQVTGNGRGDGWSFLGGSKVATTCQPKPTCLHHNTSSSRLLYASSSFSASASNVFSVGTTAVLPILRAHASGSKITTRTMLCDCDTRKCMGSMIPDTALGLLYGYLVYFSWTPDTLHLMFGAKYMVPELGGITKMFSSEMRLTSAWIHLVAVDLFAARKVYSDGMENGVETRHSVALCLLACPIGILTHLVTKALIAAMARAKTTEKLPPN